MLPSRREANFQDFALLLLHRFFINLRVHFSMDFGTIFAPRSLQHCLQNLNKKCSDFDVLFYWFLVDFGFHLGTNFPTKSHKKGGGRVKHHHTFYYFRFWSPLWGTPRLWFPRFSTQSGRIFRPFLVVFWKIENLHFEKKHFTHMSMKCFFSKWRFSIFPKTTKNQFVNFSKKIHEWISTWKISKHTNF